MSHDSKGCACERCKAECHRVPGWFSPAEAMLAMDAGLAHRISAVREHLIDIVALAPSRVGFEGIATLHYLGRCNFLSSDDRCEIHNTEFKPIECRTGFGCRGNVGPNPEEMREAWSGPEGTAAVERWRKETL